jgi:poly(3-hydroxyoctanoate) depolymerase
VAERPKAVVLKTTGCFTVPRRFESFLLRFALVLACGVLPACVSIRERSSPSSLESVSSRGCQVTEGSVICHPRTIEFPIEGGGTRRVLLQLPSGSPPAAGWPVAFIFQGSWFPAEWFFDARRGSAFGAYFEAKLIAELLDAGYAVIAPETHLKGHSFWDTNVPGWAGRWERAPDHRLMKTLFSAFDSGTLGPLDSSRLYATGISSGGYMTSRMAVSYPGRFKALAIQSASYATCLGIFCHLPRKLPANHPPTLFLHGGRDWVVLPFTMRPYHAALVRAGYRSRVIVDPSAGHECLSVAPEAIVAWFGTVP